jgi:hypothetical protein
MSHREEIERMLVSEARYRRCCEYFLAFIIGAPMLLFLFAWICGGNYGHR